LKIFVLLSRIPYPLEKGDKLRAYHQLVHLSKNNEIILFCLNDGIEDPKAKPILEKICKEVHFFHLSKAAIILNLIKGLFSKLPFQINYFYHTNAQKEIDKVINNTKPDRIYCQLIRTTEYLKKIKHIKKTLDYMDVFSKGIERRMENSSGIIKYFFNKEFKALINYEEDIFNYFEHKIIISEQDRNYIPHPNKNEITIIPNGVDVDFFRPKSVHEKTYDIVFTGNMSYPPNVAAATYLGEKIIPLLTRYRPDIKLLIAGSYPALAVLALRSENIHISGWVDDMRNCYATSKIFVAPMQIGTGLQNKLLEAMSMKLPCITTSLANNALGAKPDEQIILASTPEEFTEKILKLLNYPAEAEALAENGYNFVHQHYLWEKNCLQLEKIICS